MPKISLRDALRDALHEEMARDESIIVLGEDVIAHGGPYAVTRGIYEKYPGRIRQTPISEAGIVGTALRAALRGRGSVMFIEYTRLYTTECEVPEGDYTIPFGKADIKRVGQDVTIVATGPMVGKALEAAEILALEGIEAEVIDPRTIVPL